MSALDYGNSTAWFSNVFTASSNDPLCAVGFCTLTPNYKYHIPIEYKVNDYTSKASANSGEGYISYNGSSCADAAKVIVL